MEFRRKQPIGLRSTAAAVMLLSAGLPSPPAFAQAQNQAQNPAQSQAGPCELIPDKRSPDDRILRCGGTLTVQPAPGTLYRPLDVGPDGPPAAVQLDSGALIIEFHPAGNRPGFQIQTPQAIASVRGTEWAVEVQSGRSSILVLTGTVRVARTIRAAAVTLRGGQGVDVTDARGPLKVTTWPPDRVRALLARFGR
jgi:hypothetical protein